MIIQNFLDDIRKASPSSPTTIAVAMSGGLDSTMVAWALKTLGHRVIGITLKLFQPHSDLPHHNVENAAQEAASALEIPLYIQDEQEAFQKEVMQHFMRTYLKGKTPNPCARCNRKIKFPLIWKAAQKKGAQAFATGHYVKLLRKNGDWPKILKGSDPIKEQSYFLFGLPKKLLPFLYFPLGNLKKKRVAEIANVLNLPIVKRPESNEVCFIQGQNYRSWLRERLDPQDIVKGTFRHVQGQVLGRHQGIHQFTIGQRRGLGIAYHSPLYVSRIDSQSGEVILGPRESLNVSQIIAGHPHWLIPNPPTEPFDAQVMIRYRSHPTPATIDWNQDKDLWTISLHSPIQGVSPGQAAVAYVKNQLIGGAWIENTKPSKFS